MIVKVLLGEERKKCLLCTGSLIITRIQVTNVTRPDCERSRRHVTHQACHIPIDCMSGVLEGMTISKLIIYSSMHFQRQETVGFAFAIFSASGATKQNQIRNDGNTDVKNNFHLYFVYLDHFFYNIVSVFSLFRNENSNASPIFMKFW